MVEGDRGGVIFSLLGNKDILTGVSPGGYTEGDLEDLVGVSHGGETSLLQSPLGCLGNLDLSILVREKILRSNKFQESKFKI